MRGGASCDLPCVEVVLAAAQERRGSGTVHSLHDWHSRSARDRYVTCKHQKQNGHTWGCRLARGALATWMSSRAERRAQGARPARVAPAAASSRALPSPHPPAPAPLSWALISPRPGYSIKGCSVHRWCGPVGRARDRPMPPLSALHYGLSITVILIEPRAQLPPAWQSAQNLNLSNKELAMSFFCSRKLGVCIILTADYSKKLLRLKLNFHIKAIDWKTFSISKILGAISSTLRM